MDGVPHTGDRMTPHELASLGIVLQEELLLPQTGSLDDWTVYHLGIPP